MIISSQAKCHKKNLDNWAADIPSSWETRSLKRVIITHSGGAWGEPAQKDFNDRICMRVSDFEFNKGRFKDVSPDKLTQRNYDQSKIEKLSLDKGDILIEKSGGGKKTPVGRAVLFDMNFPALFSNFQERLRVNQTLVCAEYMEYWWRAMYYRGVTTLYIKQTTGIQNLSISDILSNEGIALPSLSEQRAIISYLDQECYKTDTIISDAQSSIEEYRKWKASIVAETVTRGLDPDAEMKDSGVVWIGYVPKHWKLLRMKYLLRNVSICNHPDAEVLSLYRDLGIVPKNSRNDNHNVTSENTSKYKLVRIGNLVINKMKAWQGSLAVSDFEGIVSPAYYVCEFISSDNINKKYFHYLLRSRVYAQAFDYLSTGIRVGQWDLGIDNFMCVPALIPPVTEQSDIVQYLDSRCSQIDVLIAEKESLIAELESYKNSLIYEIVTGKLRV